MAVIRVGGSTEVEVKEKKDRVDDAMHATKAAVEEGIVSGGGVALLRAKAAIGKLSDDNADIQAGINIVLRALESPIRQIAENSGVEGSIVVGKVLENKSQTYGFDAQTEQYVDMLNAGIVDPAKVVRVALQDAASIAGLMITTEAMVAETPKKKEAPGHARRRNGRYGLLINSDVEPGAAALRPERRPNVLELLRLARVLSVSWVDAKTELLRRQGTIGPGLEDGQPLSARSCWSSVSTPFLYNRKGHDDASANSG